MTARKGDVNMSRKKHRGKGGSPHSDGSGTVRKQKAAKFAEKNLKPTSDNSPMGNSESEDFAEDIPLENFKDNADSSKRKNKKCHGDNDTLTENTAEPQDERRLKKAAAMRQAAEYSIANSRKTDIEETEGKSKEDGISENSKEEAPPQDNDLSEADDTHTKDNSVDPQTAKRLKKAAYIKQMNEAKIAEKTSLEDEEENTEETAEKLEQTEEISDNDALPEAEPTADGTDGGEIDTDELKEAYIKEFAADQFQSRKNNKSNIPAGMILEAAKGTADFVSAVQSGDATKVVALPIKKIIEKKYGENKTLRKAKIVSSAVKNSDSVGGAAAGIGTAIAADKVKQYAQGLIFGRPDKKRKQREVKKYRHIKREKAVNAENTEKTAKIQRYKVKSVEKNAVAKKNLQRKFYLKQNKDVLTYLPKADVGRSIKKKIFAKLLAFATPMILPIFIILIVVILISSLFSWLNPFKFTFAGSNDETSAETSDEILDVYTLMIQNYMDIAQAYYYLEYGDWYGGTYDYPSAEQSLSFAEFYADKCEYIIATIREQFADALANAPNEQARANISRAMGEAISNALSQAQAGAAEEYRSLIDGLNDCMTAEEKRQHYEVVNNGGANGTADTDEFNGKPIEGTNFFDNVEIESDLSAEELMAMTSLYKTLLLIQSGGKTEDGTDYEYNITPDDIMTLFEDTEYIPITAEITHNNACAGQNCRRRLAGDYENGYSWEYYCLADHDNLNGSIDPCISKDELLEKIMELTEAEENGFDKDQCEEMIDEYIKNINDELDIDESDYRQFGSSDNERAKDFYETLIDPTADGISNNIWEIPLPVVGESEENENE